MSYVRRNFRIDSYLADKVTSYSRGVNCSESNLVEVALVHLLGRVSARGYDYLADEIERFNACDDVEKSVDALSHFVEMRDAGVIY